MQEFCLTVSPAFFNLQKATMKKSLTKYIKSFLYNAAADNTDISTAHEISKVVEKLQTDN